MTRLAGKSQGYDGDGHRVKEVFAGVTTYYFHSTVMGGAIIEELGSTGQKQAGYVYYPGRKQLATQTNNEVVWTHSTPANTTKHEIHSSNGSVTRLEFDPLGADVPLTAPTDPDPGSQDGDINGGNIGSLMNSKYAALNNPAGGCVVDGLETSCGNAMSHLNFGTGNSTSVIGNSSTTMQDIIHSVMSSLTPQLMFTPAGTSITHINVSGLKGTPGYQRIVWQWVTYGGQTVYVPVPTAYSGSLSMPGSIVSLAPSVLPQNTAPNENAIRDGLKKALSNPDCAKLIDALLNAVATKKNPLVSQYGQGGIMGMFEAVMLEDGLTRTPVPGSAGHGSVTGNIAQGDAQIFVESRSFGPADQLQADVKGVLGELMHLGGQKRHYTDRAFADIVHRDYPGLTTSIWPGDKSYKLHKDAMKNDNHIGWSYYWHQAVNRKCF